MKSIRFVHSGRCSLRPALLMLGMLGQACAVPVNLHVLLDHSGGVGVPARVSVGSDTYDIGPDGLLLDLPSGRYPLRLLTPGARLVPDQGSGEATLTVTAPVTERSLLLEAKIGLSLHAPATAVAGQPFVAELKVTNPYGLPLTLTPLLQLPEGLLALNDSRAVLTLNSGESGTLQTRLVAAAPGTYSLSGGLTEVSGLAQASLNVTAAAATVPSPAAQSAAATLTANPGDPLPGDVVTFTLTLHNPGQTPLSVQATPSLPDWLVPQAPLQTQTLSLPASGEASLSFSGRAAFGAPRRDLASVSLLGLPGSTVVSAGVGRQLLNLQVAQPEDGTVGERGSVQVLVQNPTGRPALLTLKGSGAGVTGEPVSVSVKAGGSSVAELSLTPSQSGRPGFTVVALATLPGGESVPISLPGSNRVRASAALNKRRVTVIGQPFSLRGVPGLGDPGSNASLLASQQLPEGVSYVGGSSLLNGRSIPDPRLSDTGRLYWPLGHTQAEGSLSYQVSHSSELPALPPLDLTATVGGQDIFLSGKVASNELGAARSVVGSERENLIRLPRQGTVLRGGDRSGVVLEGPVGLPVSLSVNGVAVPGSLLGEETVTLGRRRLSYAGVQFAPGKNVLEAHYGELTDRLEVTVATAPVRLSIDGSGAVADGASPVILRILALDAGGVTSGDGTVTVNTDLEPITPDANPREAGYQVRLQGGVAVLRLEPLLSARRLNISAALGGLSVQQEVFVDVQTRTRYAYQASVGVRVGNGSVSLDAQARGYAEVPLYGGQLQVAADSDGLPRAPGSSGLSANTPVDLSRFPVTGSGTEAKGALSSDFGVAFRYERRDLSVGYYRAVVDVSPLTSLPSISALRAEAREIGGTGFSVRGFVGRLPSGAVSEAFVPDGRRSYLLAQLPRAGSELVTLVAGGLSRPLLAGRDYSLDAASRTLTLASPLGHYDQNYVPQTLVVTYSPSALTSTVPTYGGSVSYVSGPWSASVAAVQMRGAAPVGSPAADFGVAYGAQLAYRSANLQASLGYQVTAFDPGGKFTLAGSSLSPDGRFTASVNLSRSDSTGLVGQAEVSARLTGFRVRLAHQSVNLALASATVPQPLTAQRTSLTAERPVLPGLTLGGGLEYSWKSATDGDSGLSGVVLARYERGNSSLDLSHSQPFSVTGGVAAQTRLSGSVALNTSTFLEGRIVKTWDELGTDTAGTVSGELGVRQTLGNVNYTVSYQLPGISGESSRARFGLAAPIPINDHLSANVSASLLRDLGNGVFTAAGAVGLRYRQDRFTATASVDAGRDFGGSDLGGSDPALVNTRLTLRGGASGSLGDQDLSFDAVYNVLPTPGGQFTFSYARRTADLALLSYTRLNSGSGALGVGDSSVGNLLEGEMQLSWQPLQGNASVRPVLRGLELQPGLAYRVPLVDRSRLALQGSLGLTVPVTDRLALAATGYVFYQPLAEAQAVSAAYALDLKYTVSPNLRLVAGYTVSQTGALTQGANPGFHIRAELFGGGP